MAGECGLSAQQRARISQNFRAAKALLERKKPRLSLSAPVQLSRKPEDAKIDEYHDQDKNSQRLPLSEICSNLRDNNSPGDSILKVHAICLPGNTINTWSEHESVFCSHGNPLKGGEHDFSCGGGDSGPGDIRDGDPCHLPDRQDSFFTPVRQNHKVELGESVESSGGGVSDDSFDDFILEEIDALCEKSAAKSERAISDSSFKEALSIDRNGEEGHDTVSLTVTSSENSFVNVHNFSSDGHSGVDGPRNLLAAFPNSIPEEYSKYIKSLNERQQDAAFSDISTPLMIVAGPGSGKTSTMVGRILMLLSKGICPSNILAMTFTTGAASEMRERIGSVAGKASAKDLTISTFHSFSLQLCRLHAEKLGRTSDFTIYGQRQQRRAVIEAVRLSEDGKKQLTHELEQTGEGAGASSPQRFKDKSRKWLKFVTQAKASGRTPEHYDVMGNELGGMILRNYNKILDSCNALDYHDLISCSVRLLTEFPEVFKHSQESWKAIVVDEFQDTSAMQYNLLRLLASHKHITIVGDEDQSIFSFNGADVSGFDSFRKDFPMHKEVKLNKNYRSTRYIVEAASSLIRNNLRRCQSKDVLTENSCGSKLTVKECSNESFQCAFIVDQICEITSERSSTKCSFGNIAVLYRRQVSGKIFQTTFRNRKIPFNIHGVAFYRKKVVKAIISMLRTALPSCDDSDYRTVFKALLQSEKEEKKKVIEHIDKVATVRKCSFISVAVDIFSAKISGTLKRAQLTQGRKVLHTIDMIKKLVHREQSISAVISSVGSMIPQKYLLEQRAVLDNDAGKLLNEDNDLRSVLEYLLDDVSDFLRTQHNHAEEKGNGGVEDKGCAHTLKAFIDLISERERENFRSRRHDNKDSVTLTTIHQSKGLEWDVVFIVKVNESEIPLLHEFNGVTFENGASVEEERRLFYVAMTRARKKLFILYLIMDSTWQILQPSRFLGEIPSRLLEIQDALSSDQPLQLDHQQLPQEDCQRIAIAPVKTEAIEHKSLPNDLFNHSGEEDPKKSSESTGIHNANDFIRRFSVDDRAVVSQLFHKWAKKSAFQDPKRLLDKVKFVIDERLSAKKSNHKDVLRDLRSCIYSDEAKEYAISILKWEQIPADQRAQIVREKQEHFQKQRVENAMSSSTPTSKQIAYLQNLGCTVTPTSRLHASRLIEQYKSL